MTMSGKIDLAQLAMERSVPTAPSARYHRSRWAIRYALPSLILASFVILVVWAARDSILPSQPVTIVPVVVAKADVSTAGTPVFQAAGWVEPRPAPIVVSSLAAGVIEELLVVEGQRVRQGQPIARLLDTDSRIHADEARAAGQLQEAEVLAARGELESAHLALENPVKLQAELAGAESALAEVEAELGELPAALDGAHTQLSIAERNLENKRAAGEVIAGRLLRQAEAELAGATALVEQLTVRQPILTRQREALQRRTTALDEQLRLKLDERRVLAAAEAALLAAEAKRQQSLLAVEAADLRHSRMQITSPIDGRILSLQATPGMRVAGLKQDARKDASGVATLYDPRKLQVRVDVRLEHLPQVQIGQRVRIETASVQDQLAGSVINVTSVADIQKNTLQVNVALEDPPDVVRPEMLVQATFLAPEQRYQPGESEELLRILVPRQLVAADGNGYFVWLADRQSRTARRRSIQLGPAGTAELVEAISGLTPTGKIISSGRTALTDGQRIRVTGEDPSIGRTVDTTARVARRVPRTDDTENQGE
jgi:HlyD family secretion protein